ncbi:DUF896 domain-containing protein [Sporolituus thermophilus]|uniref:UPF0291 protein SAMN05660235_02108 n=1 Tax=Sporolituus thermophilus DSM 23256 TaxID=1123285 RepID=A0A1G7MD37_9FIRM|nr:DUF896 domain-containing protein [Sporolituus thermophilus]SDF59566.1 protein of unknown function [Sporolituus thermophilus DSM 23256]
MITPEMIARINELARKQRSCGLSEQEKTEQATLRRQYIDHIKAQVKEQLDRLKTQQCGHTHDCHCGCHHPH